LNLMKTNKIENNFITLKKSEKWIIWVLTFIYIIDENIYIYKIFNHMIYDLCNYKKIYL
jgi:hypothetical protein